MVAVVAESPRFQISTKAFMVPSVAVDLILFQENVLFGSTEVDDGLPFFLDAVSILSPPALRKSPDQSEFRPVRPSIGTCGDLMLFVSQQNMSRYECVRQLNRVAKHVLECLKNVKC